MPLTIDESYDVIVVGGGLAGVCAAISAARHGCKTAIVHNRPVFGGNSSSEIRVAPTGAAQGSSWSRETGIIEELQLEMLVRNHERFRNGLINSVWDMVLYDAVRREPNLTCYLNTHVIDVEMASADTISAVIAVQIGSERNLKLSASLFIDCTGDATVGARAGAEFRMGREARSEFNESLAPEVADDKTQGSSLLFRARDVGRYVPFEPPAWAEDYPSEESLRYRHHPPFNKREYAGYWWIEIGAPFDTIDQNEEIRDELLRHVLGVWDHIKNHGEHGAENLALDWVGTVVAKRESRRLMGDHILTENDVREHPLFFDRVAYGGWFIDVHTMGGILAKDKPPEPSHGDPDLLPHLWVRPYSIPFRCLYSRNICNLMMAGRNLSATHIGLGSPRVMLTCAVMGQAVGTAAGLCIKYDVKPRELLERHIEELQQTLLKDDCFIIDMPNRDPNDIARGATVTGSSHAQLMLEPVDEGVADLAWWQMQIFPVTEPHIDSIALYVHSEHDTDVTLRCQFANACDIWAWSEPDVKPTKIAQVIIPANYDGWLKIPLDVDVEPNKLYRIALEPLEGVKLRTAKPTPGISTARRKPTWDRWVASKLPLAMRIEPPAFPFQPQNVVSGVARPEKWTNIWISDPSQSLPQWLELDFGEPKTFNTIYLTFDTDINWNFEHYPPMHRIPECVCDYAIEVKQEGEWRRIVTVEGNYQRRRKHQFEHVTASQLRIVVSKTNGDPSARIYEVRVYNENATIATR